MNKHPLADCESCPLKDQPYVPSYFGDPSRTRLAVVGQAPGFHDTVRKAPFSGPSGQLLGIALRHHGYKHEEVFKTNVVACRPDDDTPPPKDAIAACHKRLMHELDVARCGGDIAGVGGVAAAVLSRDSRSLTQLRIGPPKAPSEELQRLGFKRLVTTWHPSYCLRVGDAFPTFIDDLGKFNRLHLDWRAPDWAYYDETPLALQFIADLMAWQDSTGNFELAIDIEVGIEKDTAFDHPNHYQMLCIGLAWKDNTAAVIGEEAMKDPLVRLQLEILLRRSKLIGHNGKFDLAGLYPLFPKLELWFDTMLAHYVLDERPGTHGLGILAIERLGSDEWKDEIKKWLPRGGNYANIPREILYKYNAYDLANTWSLHKLFILELERKADPSKWPYPELPYKSPRDVHDFLVAASNQLMYLELNGIAVDRAYSDQLDIEYLNRLDKLEEELDELVRLATKSLPDDQRIPCINPRSPKQIKEFFATQRVHVESTNVASLERLLAVRAEGTPLRDFLTVLLKHRRDAKLHGTFVKGIRQRLYRGRVYTTYMLHGTTSGRLASRNPNLQNIVRDKAIRKQFSVSKPGNVLIQADYKQAEGRVICWLAQDEYLRSIFSDPDADLFTNLGQRLYRKDKLDKEERVRVKAYFYGLSFGREAFSIAQEFGMSVNETERELRGFFELIPNVAQWQNNIRRQVLNGEDLITPFGRSRHFPVITKQNKKDVLNEALSYLPQSTASDVCLSALIRLRPMLRGLGFVRLTIHDALVVECAESNVDQVSAMMQEVMVDEGKKLQEYVPFAVDVSVGKSWGEL